MYIYNAVPWTDLTFEFLILANAARAANQVKSQRDLFSVCDLIRTDRHTYVWPWLDFALNHPQFTFSWLATLLLLERATCYYIQSQSNWTYILFLPGSRSPPLSSSFLLKVVHSLYEPHSAQKGNQLSLTTSTVSSSSLIIHLASYYFLIFHQPYQPTTHWYWGVVWLTGQLRKKRRTYLIFVFFLHRQNFRRRKFTPKFTQ